MYFQDWDKFAQQAESLFRSDPNKTRYTLKYRHCDKKLVLKVTNSQVVLKFKTQELADIYKVQNLTGLFYQLMASGPEGFTEDQITQGAVEGLGKGKGPETSGVVKRTKPSKRRG